MKRRKKNNKKFIILGISAAIIFGIAAGFVANSLRPFGAPPSEREALIIPDGQEGFASLSEGGVSTADGGSLHTPPPPALPLPLTREVKTSPKPPQKKVASLDLSGYIVNSRKMDTGELVPEDNTPKRGTLTPAAVLRTQIPQTGHEPPNRLSIPVRWGQN